jgi:hypothetical protein
MVLKWFHGNPVSMRAEEEVHIGQKVISPGK